MAYALTREKADQAAEIVSRMVEAFKEGSILEYKPGYQEVPYLAYKIRELMASLVEFPDRIPPDARNLVWERQYMIVARPKRGYVRIVPRHRVPMKLQKIAVDSHAIADPSLAPVSMSVDLDWAEAEDLLRVKGLIDHGTLEFTGVHSVPKREEVQRILEQRLERDIEIFDPPKRIVFKPSPK